MSTELARDENGQLIPGQGSLNPGGRPKRKKWAEAIQKALSTNPTGEPNLELLEAVSAALIIAAKAGDMEAIKEIGNRLDGKPVQGVDLEANIIGDVTISWKHE